MESYEQISTKDLDLLKSAILQEVNAEKRYAKHLANVNNEKIREVLKELHLAEKTHKEALFEEIKKYLPFYTLDENRLWGMEIKKDMLEGAGDDFKLISSIININLEKEKEAMNQYKGYSKEAESDLLSELFIEFRKEEAAHVKTLMNLKKEFC